MTEAWIIDTCRTPRGIGKYDNGALSKIHPQQLAATVLKALAERTGIDIISVPPAITTSSKPAMMEAAAMFTVVMPEPQKRSSVTPLARKS